MEVGYVWRGGACVAEVCMAGGMRGGGGGMRGRRDGHCSGRYASHWNAFLLNSVVTHYVLPVSSKRYPADSE